MERLVLECPVAAVVIDAQRRVRFCNPAFERLFLYRAEDATGAELEDLVGLRETPDAADAIFRLSRGEHVHLTLRARRRDETAVDVEFHGVPDFSPGSFNGYCAFFQDITERKRTEHALRVSQAKFAKAFGASPTAVVVASARDNRLMCVNDTWVRLTGYHPGDAVGRTLLDLGLFENPADFHRLNQQLDPQGGGLRDLECRLRTKDGSIRIGSLSSEQFQTNGEAMRIIVMSDVTALRNAEATLSTVSVKLIEAQDQERFRIARDLHDDVGQRLALLQFGIDRLKNEVNGPAPDILNGLDELWKHAAEISAAVQNLSRELHSPALNFLRMDRALRGLCADINKRLNMEIDFRSFDVPGAVPTGVSLGLFRVLQEALNNSAKHSGTRFAEVELWGLPGAIHLRVKDFGKGFPVDATMENPGLGLITMRERVALMKGTFAISSPPRGGTEINVRVPLSHTDTSQVG